MAGMHWLKKGEFEAVAWKEVRERMAIWARTSLRHWDYSAGLQEDLAVEQRLKAKSRG